MKGLLLKDYYVITKQLRIFIFLIPFLAFSTGGVMSVFAIFLGAALPLTAIAYDERSKWDELSSMMPYSNFELVFSRYLLGYLCMLGATVLVLLGQMLGNVFSIEGSYDGDGVLFALAGASMFVAINIPFVLKFGSEKGRFIFIGAMALIGASGSFLQNVDKTMSLKLTTLSPVIFIIIAVIFNVVSIFISDNIQKNKS